MMSIRQSLFRRSGMLYTADQLQKLRDRWHNPLLSPDDGQPVEIEGCSTFKELLQRRIALISETSNAGGILGEKGADLESWRVGFRNNWEMRANVSFIEMMAEFRQYGIDRVYEIEASRYEVKEPCDLRGAELRSVILAGAFLENAHFEGADLTRASFDGARCFETHFEDAICEHTSFAGAECHFAHFQRANCDHASFDRADCTMTGFDHSKLRYSSFNGTVCFAAIFNGAFLANASISSMNINHLTRFGRSGEQAEAERTPPARSKKKDEGDDWYIVELFPAWLRAAEVNSKTRSLLRSHGYFWEADEYQYMEMVCRRHVLHQHPISEFFEWFFKDLMFGYGLKWKRPLISVMTIIVLWGLGFALHFKLNALHGLLNSIGYGLYYSVISFTTLGFGNAPDLEGVWPKLLLCSEALIGTILMPLFLLAYARKILQD